MMRSSDHEELFHRTAPFLLRIRRSYVIITLYAHYKAQLLSGEGGDMKIIKRPVVLMAEEKAEWLEHITRLGDPEKVFFMDIETTGFSRTYDSVYLTGFLYYEGGQFFLEQHLASDLRDEPELIDAFCDRLSDAESVVTFNGDMFDIPFIKGRMDYIRNKTGHNFSDELDNITSIDLYKMIRPYWNPVSFLVEQHLHLESVFQDERSHGSVSNI